MVYFYINLPFWKAPSCLCNAPTVAEEHKPSQPRSTGEMWLWRNPARRIWRQALCWFISLMAQEEKPFVYRWLNSSQCIIKQKALPFFFSPPLFFFLQTRLPTLPEVLYWVIPWILNAVLTLPTQREEMERESPSPWLPIGEPHPVVPCCSQRTASVQGEAWVILAGVCISTAATKQLNKGGKARVKWEQTWKRHRQAAGGKPWSNRSRRLCGQGGSPVGTPRCVWTVSTCCASPAACRHSTRLVKVAPN